MKIQTLGYLPLQTLCAARIGSLFNASEIASEVGVSTNTILSWMSILQASYVIYLLPPYYENSRMRLIKSPKLYLCDTGLACSLLGIESGEQLALHSMRGHLFENMIVMEVLKRRLAHGKEGNIYFYRDSNQVEIDLLVGNANGMDAFEIKSGMTYSSAFEKSLRTADKCIKLPITSKTIVYTGQLESAEGDVRLLNYRHLEIC